MALSGLHFYLALLQNEKFKALNFENLKFCGAGGMAMSTSVSQQVEALQVAKL